MRPRTLDDVLGQRHLMRPGSPLRKLAEPDPDSAAGPSSVILYGPPGIGKTTLAHVIARAPGRTFTELSAITAGVKDVRQVMEQAQRERDLPEARQVLEEAQAVAVEHRHEQQRLQQYRVRVMRPAGASQPRQPRHRTTQPR